MANNMQLYIESMVKETLSLAENFIGAEIETVAFNKLLHLLRDTYKENPVLFSKDQVATINMAKKMVERKKNTYGDLPLEAGYYYADRNEEFKVLEFDGEYCEIEYCDGRIEKLTGIPLNAKTVIFRNMLMDREKDPIILKLINTDGSYEEMYEKAKKPTRISHCFKCKKTVDPSCSVCYICGWYICKYDGYCGCHYNLDSC